MANVWKPIDVSGLSITLSNSADFPDAAIVDSVWSSGTGAGGAGGNTELSVADPVSLRLTALEFASNDTAGNPSSFGSQSNTNDVNDPVLWTPSVFVAAGVSSLAFAFGGGAVTGTWRFGVEALVPENPVCNAIGRTTRQYVTAYNLDRPQVVKARRGAKRCFVADFNGALPEGAVIASAVWRCTSPWSFAMSDATIYDGLRASGVTVAFGYAGWGFVKCEITTADGGKYVAQFDATCVDAPWFDEGQPATGPYSLVASF